MDSIRNVSVIAHVDHGKSTLSDAILCAGGVIAAKEAGEKRACDTRKDEQERGITIKSTGVTMCIEHQGANLKINLVDSPGHVDFSSEVTAALRITDGALVVVDAVEGPAVQTKTVLRQAITEGIKPVLVINKLDRLFMELEQSADEMYIQLNSIISTVNQLIATYSNNPDLLIDPLRCNVAFASAKLGWGFTLQDMAVKYAEATKKASLVEITKKLWTQKGFAALIGEPIKKILGACTDSNKTKLAEIMEKLRVNVSADEMEASSDKKLFALCMNRWVPLIDPLMYLIHHHLPSPVESQKQRVEILYNGPCDDACAQGIRDCNPEGPLMVYISKMVPTDGGRFIGFGRIFSGTLRQGSKVHILGPQYDPKAEKRTDYYKDKPVQRTYCMIGNKFEPNEEIMCGNTCAVMGIDSFLVKTGTLTSEPTACGFHTMKFSVSPVVKVSVKPKDTSHIDKLVEGLNKLRKSDPCVLCEVDKETKEMTVCATGELHMEICLNDLRDFLRGVEIVVGTPIVTFREAVGCKSQQQCLAKSTNKHNRIYMTAEPLSEQLVQDIESGKFNVDMDPKERVKLLSAEYDWSPEDAKKIWAFGPEGINTCVLVDATKGVQTLGDIKELCIASFKQYTMEGPLCREQMRGIRFNVEDAMIHSDPVHRGNSQIMPAVRRVMYAAVLCAMPMLYEPVFLAEVNVPSEYSGTVFTEMTKRRGELVFQESGLTETLHFTLPVAESFGLNSQLRGATSGNAFLTLAFGGYGLVSGDLADEKSKNSEYVMSTRKRKGLKDAMETVADYHDRL